MTDQCREALKPCPFCGGDAEIDRLHAYRAMNGKYGDAVMIYCLRCSANMITCYDDHPGEWREGLACELIYLWNARPGVTVPVEVVEEIETCAAMSVPSDDLDFMHDFPWIDMQQRFDEDRVYWETLCIGEADLARRLLRKIRDAESSLKGGGCD